MQSDWVLRVARPASLRAHLQQYWRVFRTRVEEEAGDFNSIHICRDHGGRAMNGSERGESQAQHYRVRTCLANGFGKVVDAGRQEQVLAFGQSRVNAGGGVNDG